MASAAVILGNCLITCSTARFVVLSWVVLASISAACIPTACIAEEQQPRFSRHVSAVLSRLGCNGGTCHGAVQGKNGFRLSLFSAQPEFDFEQIARSARGRRLNFAAPSASLLLRKPTGQLPHGGGVVMSTGSPEYQLLTDWIASGAPLDVLPDSLIDQLVVTPQANTLPPGRRFQLRVTARFADGSVEDVTHLCLFESLDPGVADVDGNGEVHTIGVGDTALIVRYRGEPVMSMVEVPGVSAEPFPNVQPVNFIDEHILAKLQRLRLPPTELAEDATFLRRVSLDVAGRLPTPEEVREFVSSDDPDRRIKKIDALLASDGHVSLWTLKFCDLLKASNFGVYADAVDSKVDAPRFQAWVRSRLQENLPYDEFAARVLTATSREGRSLDQWQQEVTALFAGYHEQREDIQVYTQRRTPDLYWQRKDATGVSGALQVAHAFLGLRLECAQCHRHPHDIWQQDDLLSFANFFNRVRGSGFHGDNEKKYPAVAQRYADLKTEGEKLQEEAKELAGELGELRKEISSLQGSIKRLQDELAAARDAHTRDENTLAAQQRDLQQQERELVDKENRVREIREMERRGKYLIEVGRRMTHAEIMHLGEEAKDRFASVTIPLCTKSSESFRLLC